MEIRSCKNCNRLFNYICGQPLCPACREALEDKFTEVKEYIYQNPHASVAEVAEVKDISIKQIKQWIREERLILSEPSADGVVCENCGTPICSGRFCDTCKSRLANSFNSALAHPGASGKKQQKDGSKMRFLH